MLQKVIHQLNENDYSLLSLQMKESKADKYLSLLTNYRKEKITDKELIERLNVNPIAFYTLKSRLSEKIQLFLFKNTVETRIELIQNVAKVEHLVYNTPRETSIQILKKLETDLIKNDMPYELTTVYKALRKLELYSNKYYDYSRLYNKYVAYNLAHDKVEDLLSLFCKTLGEYYLSRDEKLLNRLILFKQETKNVCRLYKSHRLKIYQNILNIHYSLFLSDIIEVDNGVTVEFMLAESKEILAIYGDDKLYKHLVLVIDFLYFEYYHQLKLYKNAQIYYDKIVNKTNTLLLLFHSCFASHFLISKIEYQAKDLEGHSVDNEPNVENIPSFILFNYYKATISFNEGRYGEAIQRLNKILSDISLKNILFSEVEIKLFLATLYLFNRDKEHATIILRNIQRKITEEEGDKYFCALLFIKLLKSLGKEKGLKKDEKNNLMNRHFMAANSGRYKILEFLSLKDEMLAKIK